MKTAILLLSFGILCSCARLDKPLSDMNGGDLLFMLLLGAIIYHFFIKDDDK
jgi:hypothetical protein